MHEEGSVRKPVAIILGFLLACGSASCGAAPRAPTAPAFAESQLPDANEAPSPGPATPAYSSACPPATGQGTIAPTIVLQSITLLVNDAELTLSDGDELPSPPGSSVRVKEVKICVGAFSADGGEACVDFVPTNHSGQEINAEHAGTHLVPLTPGVVTLQGPDHTWTIDDGWNGITAVVNHWPGVRTEDLECADGQCERDDWLILLFQ
jgi:hypothetical protein